MAAHAAADDASVEALLIIETEVLLRERDVRLIRLRAPEGEGGIVVRAGIADTVEVAAVRQIVARVARVKRKLQDLHAGKAGIVQQLHDLRRGIAQVLGDEVKVTKPAGQHADE